MKQMTDYEAAELARKAEQQKAIRAEEKRDWKQLGLRFALYMAMTVATYFCVFHYTNWLQYDWFTPPGAVLTESEFRELVAGYPLLAEALGGTYSDNVESMTRGRTEYERDLNGDGAADVKVQVWLFGKYEMMGHQNVQREPEVLQYNGRRQHDGIDQLFKGRALAVREETIYVKNHEAEVVITVQDPSKNYVEARAEVEKLLAIVRKGKAE